MPGNGKIAICPGTFDPVTLGHVDIVERGLAVFDRVVVAVAEGARKQPLFSLEERAALLRETFRDRKGVEVKTFRGLLVDFTRQEGAKTILRGLRTVSDFEYEVQMASANRFLASDVETLFMMTDNRYSHLSSSLIREIVALGGTTAGMVPDCVQKLIDQKCKEGRR